MAQCSAHRSDGQPCRANAIKGGTVCYVHGGAAPQVKRKAAERLAEARDTALDKFGDCLKAGIVEPKTLLDASVKLTELVETLEGRVARREEQRQTPYADLSDAELEREIVREAEAIARRATEASGS
jgi:hypothetical protein